MLLSNRPTVQEDGGDIIFKVRRNLCFMFKSGIWSTKMKLGSLLYSWRLIIDGSSAGTTNIGSAQVDLNVKGLEGNITVVLSDVLLGKVYIITITLGGEPEIERLGMPVSLRGMNQEFWSDYF